MFSFEMSKLVKLGFIISHPIDNCNTAKREILLAKVG